MKLSGITMLAAVAVLALPGCVRMKNVTDISNDGSVVLKMTMGYKTEAIETIKAMAESQGAGGPEMDEAFGELDNMFDEKKFAEKMKESGLEVVSTKKTEENGWRTVAFEGKAADISVWLNKAAEVNKAEAKKHDLPPGLEGLAGSNGFVPSFFKTADPAVGEIVLLQPLKDLMAGMPVDLDALDEMEDEELEQAEMAMDMVKNMFSANEVDVEMILNLPGEIKSVQGCKKSGEKGIAFTMKGGDLNIDNVKNLFGLKNGISATFAIPEGCKIPFKDKAPAGGEKPKDQEEPKEKKGGLKVGGGL